MTIKSIVVQKIYSDAYMEQKKGEYFDASEYKQIIKEDINVYNSKGVLLLKFRKNVISKDLTEKAAKSFSHWAQTTVSKNRGASAGVLDEYKLPAYVGPLIDPGKFRTSYISAYSGEPSKQNVSNLSPSNIAGYYDKKDRNFKDGAKCRTTAFTREYVEKWKDAIPFIECCDQLYKKLSPIPYKRQLLQCEKTPKFQIAKTAFSTITVNYSWRTALHQDKGDFVPGYGNLIVVEDRTNPNTYQGCYFGLTQYGVCVDVRDGDFLLADVHQWHCNTEFVANSDTPLAEFKAMYRNNDWNYNRLSFVMYYRTTMHKCQNLNQ